MSIAKCADCGILIDTDKNPEFYREDLNNKLVCEQCWEDEQYDGVEANG